MTETTATITNPKAELAAMQAVAGSMATGPAKMAKAVAMAVAA